MSTDMLRYERGNYNYTVSFDTIQRSSSININRAWIIELYPYDNTDSKCIN